MRLIKGALSRTGLDIADGTKNFFFYSGPESDGARPALRFMAAAGWSVTENSSGPRRSRRCIRFGRQALEAARKFQWDRLGAGFPATPTLAWCFFFFF